MDLSAQVNHLESENRHLRIKGEADEKTIAMLKADNEFLRNDVERMIREKTLNEDTLRRERDEARSTSVEIEGLLTQTANFIVQGLRARKGNLTPASIPDRPLRIVEDERLPKNTI